MSHVALFVLYTWVSALSFVHRSHAISGKFITPVVFMEVFSMFTQDNIVVRLRLIFSTFVAMNLPICSEHWAWQYSHWAKPLRMSNKMVTWLLLDCFHYRSSLSLESLLARRSLTTCQLSKILLASQCPQLVSGNSKGLCWSVAPNTL
jgi:hypothetical protein